MQSIHAGQPFRSIQHETITLNVPELEALLTRGGMNETAFDLTTMIGYELLDEGPALVKR